MHHNLLILQRLHILHQKSFHRNHRKGVVCRAMTKNKNFVTQYNSKVAPSSIVWNNSRSTSPRHRCCRRGLSYQLISRLIARQSGSSRQLFRESSPVMVKIIHVSCSEKKDKISTCQSRSRCRANSSNNTNRRCNTNRTITWIQWHRCSISHCVVLSNYNVGIFLVKISENSIILNNLMESSFCFHREWNIIARIWTHRLYASITLE